MNSKVRWSADKLGSADEFFPEDERADDPVYDEAAPPPNGQGDYGHTNGKANGHDNHGESDSGAPLQWLDVDGGLDVLCLFGEDATLCAATGKSGRVETTQLYRQIYEAAGDIKPKNISIDTLSRAFAGNEIDRVQVYGYAMHMQALALVAGASVTTLSHPSLAGIASGSGISGSTAWHNAFRFRQYLTGIKPDGGDEPDGDLRQLEFKKNQYGPLGETVVIRYQRGLFLPEASISGLDKIAREARADEVFLDLLKRFSGEGRNVSEKPTAPTYAPAAFAKETEAKKVHMRKPDLEGAMRRLFASGKIYIESYGRPSRPYSRLAVKGATA